MSAQGRGSGRKQINVNINTPLKTLCGDIGSISLTMEEAHSYTPLFSLNLPLSSPHRGCALLTRRRRLS